MQLNEQEKKHFIRVCAVSPALVKSSFISTMHGGDAAKSDDTYSKSPHLESEDVAAAVKYIVAAPKHVQVHDIILRHKHAVP